MKKLLLSLAVVLTAAGMGIGDDAEKDLKKLTGTWEEVSHVADGKAMTADEVKVQGRDQHYQGDGQAGPGPEAEGGGLGDRGVRHGGQGHL
jgi:hypothetical protein